MTEDQAWEEISHWIGAEDELYSLTPYVLWLPTSPKTVTLDGDFIPDELEAIAYYMRATTPK